MAATASWPPKQVGKQDVHQFMLAAVLIPLHGKPIKGGSKELTTATNKLAADWQTRVRDLADYGLDLNVERMLSCRPAFVVSRDPRRDCRRWRICPFCWARRAVSYWQRADACIFPGAKDPIDWLDVSSRRHIRISGGRADRVPVDLIYRVSRIGPLDETIDASKTGGDGVQETLPLLLRSRSPAARKAEWDLWGPGRRDRSWGMLECVAISFAGPGSISPQWQMEVRQLWAVPSGFDWDAQQAALPPNFRMDRLSSQVEIIRRPSRRALAVAMVRIYTYPRALLYGDARWAADLMAAIQHQRAPYPYGLFRKGKEGNSIHVY